MRPPPAGELPASPDPPLLARLLSATSACRLDMTCSHPRVSRASFSISNNDCDVDRGHGIDLVIVSNLGTSALHFMLHHRHPLGVCLDFQTRWPRIPQERENYEALA